MLQRKLVWSQQLEFHHQEKDDAVSFFCTVTELSCIDVSCKFNTFKLYSYRVQTALVRRSPFTFCSSKKLKNSILSHTLNRNRVSQPPQCTSWTSSAPVMAVRPFLLVTFFLFDLSETQSSTSHSWRTWNCSSECHLVSPWVQLQPVV